MGRPKGFSPPPCPECGNKGRHKVDCSRRGSPTSRGSSTREKGHKHEPQVEADPPLAYTLAPVHTYVSYKSDYKCPCGEHLELGRQHWVDNSGRHLCMNCASDEVKSRSKGLVPGPEQPRG